MRNPFGLMALFIVFLFASSCGHLMPEKAVDTLFGQKTSPQAEQAVKDFPINRTAEVLLDTLVPHLLPEVPVYIKSGEKVVNATGDALAFESYYTELPSKYRLGAIYILTASIHSIEWEYVSAPALVFNNNRRIKVQKKFISLNPDGTGAQPIYVQTE